MKDIVKELQENQELREVLKSWQEIGYLNLIPSYQDNRDLKNEKSRAVLDKEQYNLTINSLRDELATLKQALNLPLMKELNAYDKWEDIEDEEVYEDGELTKEEVQSKIIRHVFDIGNWKLMRRKL